MRFSLILVILALSVSLSVARKRDRPDGGRPERGTAEDMRKRHEFRTKTILEKIEENTGKIEAHESGRSLLEDEEYERIKKQTQSFKKKLKKMENYDDKEFERMAEEGGKRERHRRDRAREL